ncbi:hypothetical protein JQ581_12035 [Bradyrhizobium liaoningense]|uniref:hypothetical protein n=1 Tax=Bradyrhizobium liaoningense TaxID=43992 RepID=UPI001BA7DB8A|nr:hypothetical protein [Bradyrhizobium liaoningense]MBR0737657.1 hypothetical protein [Bradyrhizobium liaoningense]
MALRINGFSTRQALVGSLMLLLGSVGIFWSSIALPLSWHIAPAREISARIIGDDRFKPEALAEMQTRMAFISQPIVLPPELTYAKALLAVCIAEEATQRYNLDKADLEVDAAEVLLRAALTINPKNSLLWLMLYSVATMHRGFDLSYLSYLEQSYALGANEGWVALRRNSLALASFPLLNSATQQSANSEFAAILNSGFVDVAAINLMRVGPVARDGLLKGLDRVDITPREALARKLLRDGVSVSVPGVKLDERLWR